MRRLRLVADRERTRLRAASAGDTGVLADEARSGSGLHLERVDRAYVEAFGGRALEARLLMELAAVGVRILDHLRDLRRWVVEDTNARHSRETFALVLLGADDLARETADAEARVGEDDAGRELRLLRCRSGRQAQPADGVEGDERYDGSGATAQEIAAGEIRLVGRSVVFARSHVHPHRTSALLSASPGGRRILVGKLATLTTDVNLTTRKRLLRPRESANPPRCRRRARSRGRRRPRQRAGRGDGGLRRARSRADRPSGSRPGATAEAPRDGRACRGTAGTRSPVSARTSR